MSNKQFSKVTTGSLAPKSVFNYGGIDWLVLDKLGDGVLCLAKKPYLLSAFDTDNYNNWEDSSLRDELNNDFLEAMEKEGAELKNFLPMVTDLTADDGLKDYDRCEDLISLISCDQYRKYRAIIPNADGWWWTCTPYSTKANGYSYFVRYVNSDGSLHYGNAYHGHWGVRPLCTLSSSILVSPTEVAEGYTQNVSEDVENSTQEEENTIPELPEERPAQEPEPTSEELELVKELEECVKKAQERYKKQGGDLLELVNATGAVINIRRALQIGILREVSALRAENAELRRQLENSVALPCKVGATIWIIINEFPQFGGKYLKSEEVLEVSSNGRIWTDGCEYDTDDIGEQIFLTKAEAEQTLKERENNGDEYI